MGIFYGFFWPSIEAYTSETTIDTSEHSHKKRILSFCIGWSIGYMLGPLLAGVLSQYFLPASFILVIIFYAIELMVILINLPYQKPPSHVPTPHKTEINDSKPIKNISFVFIQLILTVFLYAITSKILYTYFVDYAVEEEGILLWSKTFTGLVLFIFGVGRTLYFIINYYWISIRSSMKLNIFTFLAMSICIGIIPLFTSIIALSIIMFLAGICSAIIYSSTLDLILHKEKKGKGAKAGLFESMVGLGSILTPIAAGALAETVSYQFPFYGMAGLILLVFVVFFCIELFSRKRS
jgi:predicted MFS family arabinose efflux permease